MIQRFYPKLFVSCVFWIGIHNTIVQSIVSIFVLPVLKFTRRIGELKYVRLDPNVMWSQCQESFKTFHFNHFNGCKP